MLITEYTDERGAFLCIVCPNGEFLIDADDRDLLGAHKWRVYNMQAGRNPYIACSIKGKTVLLHRLVMEAPKGIEVDHRDWDGLNNRRYNLRFATRAQNRANCRRFNHVSKSGRGVYEQKNGRFTVVITIKNKAKYFGTYDTAEEAARVRDLAVIEAHGEFAVLNTL
jgi:HNH endonuclease